MAKLKTDKAGPKKISPKSGAEQVDEFMNRLDHPLKEIVSAIRTLILDSNKKITEHIKWNAPSFCIDDVDKITFNLHKNEYVMLVFHKGAKAKSSPSKETLFKDDSGMLEWVANDRAVLKLLSLEEAHAKSEQLKKLFIQWIRVSS